MKLTKLAISSLLILGFGHAGLASESSPAGKSTPSILGFLDPKTGAFRPVAPAAVQPEATTTVTGTLVFDFMITVKSTFPQGAVLTCSVTANTYDSGSEVYFDESVTATSTGTGSTVKCAAIIPYAWSLASASGDSISINYVIEATNAAGTIFYRYFSTTAPSIKVPASGTTTTETIAATL